MHLCYHTQLCRARAATDDSWVTVQDTSQCGFVYTNTTGLPWEPELSDSYNREKDIAKVREQTYLPMDATDTSSFDEVCHYSSLYLM